MVWFITTTVLFLFIPNLSFHLVPFSPLTSKDSSNSLSFSSCNIPVISFRAFDDSPVEFDIVYTLTHSRKFAVTFLTSVSFLCHLRNIYCTYIAFGFEMPPSCFQIRIKTKTLTLSLHPHPQSYSSASWLRVLFDSWVEEMVQLVTFAPYPVQLGHRDSRYRITEYRTGTDPPSSCFAPINPHAFSFVWIFDGIYFFV